MADTNTSAPDKTMGGYRIAIAVLAVVLVGLSALYFINHSQQKAEYVVLVTERDSIQANLTELMSEFAELETTNEKLNASLESERLRADSIITALKKERSVNYSTIRRYENEVKSLRSMMSKYLAQIDSLNAVNAQLSEENVEVKKQLSETELRAQQAEDLNRQLEDKVRIGERLVAHDIAIVPINSKDRAISRIKKAAQLSINFVVAANELTKAGNTEIYARITTPEGFVLTTAAMPTFDLNGSKTSYTASREVNYQNADLEVSIFYQSVEKAVYAKGDYKVELYNNGSLIGTSVIYKK
ncbi:MAG: hypothetical protein R3Y16_01760 [Rikenellaceae bacterium]